MSRRLLSVVGSQARTAALVAGALALGASGALALSAPTLVSAASSQTSLDAVGATGPEDTAADAAGDLPAPADPAAPVDPAAPAAPADPAAPVDPAAPAGEVVEGSTAPDAPADLPAPAADLLDDGPAGPAPADLPTPDEDVPDGPPSAAPVACEDAATHGEYVSGVARSTAPGPGRGAVISAAARSDCGKPAAQAGDANDAASEAKGKSKGKGGGQGQGKGLGQGKGKGPK